MNLRETERLIATVIVWVAYLFMININISSLGAWTIGLAFVLMIPLIVVTGGMWGMFNYHGEPAQDATQAAHDADAIEKRKRDRIDAVLRDLSDDDLQRLQQRLSTGTINDDDLYGMMIGDDGELVMRAKE